MIDQQFKALVSNIAGVTLVTASGIAAATLVLLLAKGMIYLVRW